MRRVPVGVGVRTRTRSNRDTCVAVPHGVWCWTGLRTEDVDLVRCLVVPPHVREEPWDRVGEGSTHRHPSNKRERPESEEGTFYPPYYLDGAPHPPPKSLYDVRVTSLGPDVSCPSHLGSRPLKGHGPYGTGRTEGVGSGETSDTCDVSKDGKA